MRSESSRDRTWAIRVTSRLVFYSSEEIARVGIKGRSMSLCRQDCGWDRSDESPGAGLTAHSGSARVLAAGAAADGFSDSCPAYMLATWIPHYVTWPWYCDHDHFAQLAQLWDSGTARPYRDVFTFQFPGEIYVFWVLGKVFGWVNSIAFYAFDAILVIGFGVYLSPGAGGSSAGSLPGSSVTASSCIITSTSITASPPSETGTPLSCRSWACRRPTSLPAAAAESSRVSLSA